MRKFGLVLATVAALLLNSLPLAQSARADGGLVLLGALVVGNWAYCHAHKGKAPFCWWYHHHRR